MKRKYGWIRDLPDHRDHQAAHGVALMAPIVAPPSVDLRDKCPPVYDQGQLGSCTANAIAAALEYDDAFNGHTAWMRSRLLIYYNERELEGTVASDSGAQIRDGIKVVANEGACDEALWPYDISQFAVKPPDDCYTAASQHKALAYERLEQDLESLRQCLAAGYPFVFGFTVYGSFESDYVARTGHVPMPNWFERVLGGHAVMSVGYDDQSKTFTIRNSWGSSWGDGGYCYMPYAYLTGQLASDFWTIRQVS